MAATEFGVNHPLAVKLWSRRLFHEVIKETWVGKFMGEDSNSLIQIQPEPSKGPGDQVTVGLRMLLSGAGIQGDDTLEGNEEALTTYNDALVLNQLRHATRSKGKMSEQRVPFSVREENRMALRDWWAERIEIWAANQLANNTAQTDTRYTGNNSTFTVDANHLLVCGPNGIGSTGETSISSTTVPGTGNYFTLADLDRAVTRAKTLSPKIRPIRAGGKDYYVCFLHPYQVYGLRQDTSTTTGWQLIQRAAMSGGDVANNPIFTGALGVYNNVVLHEWSYVPTGVSASAVATNTIRRAIFGGAQAANMVYGQDNGPNQMSWVEELFDFGNQLGVSAGMIAGMKATQFNSQNFGTIVMSSYAPTV
jgi:N4-gp56 family major capsid protein